MLLRIHQVSVPLIFDEELLRKKTARKVGCRPEAVRSIQLKRRSLDTRSRNPEPLYVLTVDVDAALTRLGPRAKRRDIEILKEASQAPEFACVAPGTGRRRPWVVGAGPAGLTAALELALAGLKPILVERGEAADARAGKVKAFWREGALDPESNVLYGEGGAGLFSDGKLTARSKERGLLRRFFEHLVACGADPDILVDAEPHIGSDTLLRLVPALRSKIIDAGGEVRFGCRLDDLHIGGGSLQGLVIDGSEEACSCCVLATGHSARDVYDMLLRRGVELTPKPFAVGVRLELPQEDINRAQYGRFNGHPMLGAASFRVTRRAESGVRACYSFCMCPGGKVISCASEEGHLTTNGMSYSRRSLPFGNAAFLVPVTPEDAGSTPLGGVAFQRRIEDRGFVLGHTRYALPAVRLVDFLEARVSDLPEARSWSQAVAVEFRDMLPDFVCKTLVFAIPRLLRELNGVCVDDVLLYGPETRSSAPLRIARGEGGESVSVSGLYPAGEGAGYAGGIVSSALDGMKQARQILQAVG